MSDGRKVPEHNAPQEEGSKPAAAPARTVTNPGMRVITATRTAPAPKAPEGPVSKRLASEASNHLLNAFSIVKELVQDFGAADRYVKAKAGIVGGWIFISLVSFIIACPGRSVETADLGARVTVLPNAERPKSAPSLTVTNTDDDPWEEVLFVVNGKYRATVEKINAGDIFTLTPKSLLSPAGPMPSDERFRSVEMRTKHGKSELVKDGHPSME